MVYKLVLSNSFKKDYKLVKKQGKDVSLLDKIIPILLSGKKLPAKYKDHELKGDWKGFRELHISPDWLLFRFYNVWIETKVSQEFKWNVPWPPVFTQKTKQNWF